MNTLKKNYNRVEMREGHFDFLSPGETQTEYLFKFRDGAPGDLARSFVVKSDEYFEGEDFPLETAENLKVEIDKYLYTSMQRDIPLVIDYLRVCSRQDAIDMARYRIAKAELDIREAMKIITDSKKTLDSLIFT
uniref:Uncharacterized protein n=1 Tax=viral metagenome TaxID=1070528 RepID=A0A6M3LC88_9ZZZZ